jgi:ubiquinone/menaquinone biosynthesis C-methylase UbiE
MAHRLCLWWLGYLTASPLRQLVDKPAKILAPYVSEGMTVLEPGPGMGFFTLELARRVGPRGRVVAVDVQPRMLNGLRRRATKAGLLERIDARLATRDSLGISDLADVDFVLAFAMVHELPAVEPFFAEMARVLRPGGFLLLAEPKGHVNPELFDHEVQAATDAGFVDAGRPSIPHRYAAILTKR